MSLQVCYQLVCCRMTFSIWLGHVTCLGILKQTALMWQRNQLKMAELFKAQLRSLSLDL